MQDKVVLPDDEPEPTGIEWESIWSVPRFLLIPYIVLFSCMVGFGAGWVILPNALAKDCGWQDCLITYAPVASGLAIASAAFAMLAVNALLVVVELTLLVLIVVFELLYLVIRLLWDLFIFIFTSIPKLLKHIPNYSKRVRHGTLRALQRMGRQ